MTGPLPRSLTVTTGTGELEATVGGPPDGVRVLVHHGLAGRAPEDPVRALHTAAS